MGEKKTYTGYYPRPHQEWLHARLRRFNVICSHRRFGKTIFAVNEMLDQALRNQKKDPQYFYLAPTYGQAKRVAWDILKNAVRSLPGVKVNEAELRVDIQRGEDRVRFQLLGAENPDSARGLYMDGAVLDEYASMDPTVWSSVIRPALSDRKGWAIFISTPQGTNHFQKIYMAAKKDFKNNPQDSEWFTALFRADKTGIIPESELEAARMTMSDAEFRTEYLCDFSAAIVGAYYGEYIETAYNQDRVRTVPHQPGYPVDTGWDIGIDDSTAIWFAQTVGREVHLIDYLEVNGKGLPEIVKMLKDKPYIYRDHYLPHDAGARELGTGKTRQETLRELGLAQKERLVLVTKHKIEDGINAARLLLPQCWFDSEACDYGIEALRNYEREYNAKEGVFKSRPRHNWASHGADAFRSLAMGYRPEEKRQSIRNLPREAEDLDYDILGEDL